MAGVKISIDIKGVEQKLSPQNHRRGQFAMTNQMLMDMNTYVPADSHALRQTGHADKGGEYLEWRTPYAAVQYQGFYRNKNGTLVVFNEYTTPGTGPEWDKPARRRYLKKWKQKYLEGADIL